MTAPARRFRVLIAPNAFKGTLTAGAAAEALAKGLSGASPRIEIDRCPVADGGDGTLDLLAPILGATISERWVTGPFGEPLQARYGVHPGLKVGIVELAEAAGLRRAGSRRDPLTATTFGVGELLRHLRLIGVKTILLGVGGSATVDAGAGLAEALGWRLCDGRGLPIPPGGGGLALLHHIVPPDATARWKRGSLIVLTDVENVLPGPGGAARVFGPQKGATPAQVGVLDRNLEQFMKIVRRDLGIDPRRWRGGGAAGGAAAGARIFAGATLVRGAEWIAREIGLAARIRRADAVITGEGCFDDTSLHGKAPGEVVRLARRARRPVFVVAGRMSLSPASARRAGIRLAMEIGREGESPDRMKRDAPMRLRAAGAALAEVILA